MIRAKQLWSVRIPNRANFAFDYYLACWLIIALYLPGENCSFVPCSALSVATIVISGGVLLACNVLRASITHVR